MFRMPSLIDPAEEQKRVRADVRNNFIFFGMMCLAFRIAPFLLEKARVA